MEVVPAVVVDPVAAGAGVVPDAAVPVVVPVALPEVPAPGVAAGGVGSNQLWLDVVFSDWLRAALMTLPTSWDLLTHARPKMVIRKTAARMAVNRVSTLPDRDPNGVVLPPPKIPPIPSPCSSCTSTMSTSRAALMTRMTIKATPITPIRKNPLSSEAHDGQERLRLERSAAHERAVNVLHPHQVFDVLRLDRAAILDDEALSRC